MNNLLYIYINVYRYSYNIVTYFSNINVCVNVCTYVYMCEIIRYGDLKVLILIWKIESILECIVIIKRKAIVNKLRIFHFLENLLN